MKKLYHYIHFDRLLNIFYYTDREKMLRNAMIFAKRMKGRDYLEFGVARGGVFYSCL